MPKVKFLPDNRMVDAEPGASLLDIAIEHDIPLAHACGGLAACTTCQVSVEEGPQNLTPAEDIEEDRLEGATPAPTLQSRLGCQARVQGDVTVRILNRERP